MKRALTILSVALLWPVSAAAQFDAPRETRHVLTQPEAPSSTPATPNRGAQVVPTAPARTAAPTTPSPQATADDSMRFELVTEGPAELCADRCRTWIMASGRITN